MNIIEITLKLVLAVALGGLVGLERETLSRTGEGAVVEGTGEPLGFFTRHPDRKRKRLLPYVFGYLA